MPACMHHFIIDLCPDKNFSRVQLGASLSSAALLLSSRPF